MFILTLILNSRICQSKQFSDYGKIYSIKKNSISGTTLPTSGFVDVYIQDYLNDIKAEMLANVSSNNRYTLVFPKMNYIIENQLVFDLTSTSLDNITLSIIGIKDEDVNNVLVTGTDESVKTNFINSNLIDLNFVKTQPNSPNFLSYTLGPMPKLIYNGNSSHLPEDQIFCLFNNHDANGNIKNNTINIMGLEIQGEAYGHWPSLQPHPFFNTLLDSKLFKLYYWKNIYLDNNYMHDHYGSAVNIISRRAHDTNPGSPPEILPYQNNTCEVVRNVILNVYGYLPTALPSSLGGDHDSYGDGILGWGIKNGLFKENFVYNDLNITGMCGRLAIGGEILLNCNIEDNQVSGYQRNFQLESDGGNNAIYNNRSTGTISSVMLSNASNMAPNPNKIIKNYFSNVGIPNTNLLWGNPPNDGDLFYWMNYLYARSMVNFHATGPIYNGTQIYGNEFVIDKDAGSGTMGMNYTFIQSATQDLDIECNQFTSNYLCTPSNHNNYGFYITSQPGYFMNNIIENAFQFWCPLSSSPFNCSGNTYAGYAWHTQSGAAVGTVLNPGSPNPTIVPTNAFSQTNHFYCNAEFGSALPPKHYLEGQPDYLISTLGSGSFTGNTFSVHNNLVIDQSTTFTNCTFLFTSNSKVTVLSGYALTFNSCTLKAGCNAMWDGIYASDPDAEIVMNGSTLQDMENGVVVVNGAKINCQSNHFTDNFVGMHFENTPAGYVSMGSNKGIVLKNTFTSSGNNLLPPKQNEQLACTGIEIVHCREIEIGELVAQSNNTFNTLRTGINVVPKSNDNNIIRLLNNHFLNIHKDFSAFAYPEEELTKKFYTKDKGAGIFVPNGNTPNSSNTRILHVEALPNDGRFEDCDKAVVGNNISANVLSYTVRNCKGGLLFNDARAQRYWIQSNHIDNAFLGIQFLGNLQRAIVVNHVATYGAGISTQNEPIWIDPMQNNQLDRLWPKGIDVKFDDYKHTGEVLIDNNTIHLKAIGGKGISLFLTGLGVTARNNTVEFVTQDLSEDDATTLVGIQSLVSFGNHINCNVVNGSYPTAVWEKRNSQGIILGESGQANLECNSVHNTWHGNLVYGNCTTSPLNVKGNTFNRHAWGMLFVPSIFNPEGTFGDIGDLGNDNNNQFTGVYSNPGGYHVFRYCNPGSNFLNYIFTSQPLISGNYGGLPYFPQQAPNPYDCIESNCVNNNSDPNYSFIDEAQAENIVNDSIQFPYFPEVAQWVAESRLYSDLDRDSATRSINSSLNSFYIQKSQESLGDIFSAEAALNLMSDSLSSADTSVYNQRLQDAILANNAISSSHNYEMNQKIVNDLYLKINLQGRDSLSVTEIQQLENIAKSCPGIEGTAVYKARTLYSMYEPALDYNDLQICNPNNKNSVSYFNGLNSFLTTIPTQIGSLFNEVNTTHSLPMLNNSEIKVHPNPAIESIYLTYNFENNQNGTLFLYDICGELVKKTLLNSNQKLASIDVSDLNNGLYMYKVVSGKRNFVGKISILR